MSRSTKGLGSSTDPFDFVVDLNFIEVFFVTDLVRVGGGASVITELMPEGDTNMKSEEFGVYEHIEAWRRSTLVRCGEVERLLDADAAEDADEEVRVG